MRWTASNARAGANESFRKAFISMTRKEFAEAELARWIANNEPTKQREAEKAERLRLKATKK